MKAVMTTEPSRDCPLCPRLVAFRKANRKTEPAWFNAPVPCFGPVSAELVIVGLAPGLRGANRTGRPFTGDYAGDLLYATLSEYGFARGKYEARPDDGFHLVNARIVNAVRCVPPQNKPTPLEIKTCRRFLIAAMQEMKNAKAIVALGKIAHDSTVAAFGEKLSRHKFAHGAKHEIAGYTLFDSYHCSRYNTNTGVLTPKMFHAVFAAVKKYLKQ
jgi:uracil-DNA glycosylase family 4